MEGKSGVREAYDQMASRYDDSKHLYWTRKMEKGEEKAVKKWVKNLATSVLDVGCGTGRYTLRKAAEGFEVVALDISVRMLKKTVDKARKLGVYFNIYPIIADGEHLPFKDELFNGLICSLTFDHFCHPELAANEFSRVLKRSGLCVLTTFNSRTLSDFKRRYGLPADKVPFHTEDMPPTLIYEVGHSAKEMEELFAKYGFDIVDKKGCCYWHFLPLALARYYKLEFDSLFNLFRAFLKYAELHAALMKKQCS